MFKTRTVQIGNLYLGGGNPVRVQTMLNTDTLDVEASFRQAKECIAAGAELIRLSTQTVEHVHALNELRKELAKAGIEIPLIADVHFSSAVALEALKYADKVRINPGNFPQKDLEKFIETAKENKKAIRIGVNYGSLSDEILKQYGEAEEAVVAATLDYLRFLKGRDFENLIVAIKSSSPIKTIKTNKLFIQKMVEEKFDYPLHLGVTEAGSGDEGRAKTALGIGTLLAEGIGDTVRVSLTEDPVNEVKFAYELLQASGRRITKTEFVSCPSCGRTLFDIQKVVSELKECLADLRGLKIAVMGCVVNGLGEARDADFAYVGGKPGMVSLYVKGELVEKDVPEEGATEKLLEIINLKLKMKNLK